MTDSPGPRPGQLHAQEWLRSLDAIEGVDVATEWDALDGRDLRSHPTVTVIDPFARLGEQFAARNMVQIDVWSTDRAAELADAIWAAAREKPGVILLGKPKHLPGETHRQILELEFRTLA